MKTKSGNAAARNSGASENCVSANSRASIAGRAVAAESCARSIDCIGWQISVLQHGVFEPVTRDHRDRNARPRQTEDEDCRDDSRKQIRASAMYPMPHRRSSATRRGSDDQAQRGFSGARDSV